MKKQLSFSKLGLFSLMFLMLTFAGRLSAQLSGTLTVPGSYPTLQAAITDLNAQGVGAGGVVINVTAGYTETAPAGGFEITTSTGSLGSPIVIQKSGVGANPTITANAALTSGSLNDAIIKLIGADFVTIDGITLQENPANLTTTAATNNMTEWGIALLYANTTNGAQNNTIKNCNISLNRLYPNTFGIYSNSTHSPTTVSTTASATGTGGNNSGLSILGNSVSNVNIGIVVIGPTAAADHNNLLVIGGIGNGNTITNFGTTGTFSSYANVSGTVNGILVRNTINYEISYNTIASSNGGTTAGTLRGIFIPSFSSAPTGVATNSINNNSISLRSAVAAGVINGINVEGTTSNNTSTLNINNNDFNNTAHTLTASAAITFISQSMAVLNQNINNNTFTNLSVNTTGSVTFISNSVSATATSVYNINGNSVVTAFNKTGAGGTVTFFTSNASSVTGSQINNNNNNFSNVTVTGATTIAGWSNTDGGGPTKNVNNNTFTNITGGTSAVTIMNLNFGINLASGNTISTITGGGAITGISRGASGTVGNLTNNTISNLTSTGAAAVTGIAYSGAGTGVISKNKIYDLTVNNAGGSVIGVSITGTVSPLTVSNNLIGNLTAPISSSTTDAVRGFSITSSGANTTINVYYNTVYLNASSSGANFSSSAIFHTSSATATTAALDLRNNIFVNKSTPNGTGITSAYRKSSTPLNNFLASSNNNLFYAGTPSASRLVFFDGTNSIQTLNAYKTLVSPREALSITEDVAFVSLLGADPNFLRISPSVPTQIESGAQNITGITDDYSGLVRAGNPGYTGSGVFPDMGAFEGEYILQDLLAPTISYSALLFTCSTGDRAISATISDATGVPTTGAFVPRVYYRKNMGAWFSSPGVLSSGTSTNGSWNFTIIASDMGGLAIGDTVKYYVIAQDAAGTPNIGSNASGAVATDVNTVITHPSAPLNYTINNTLNGTYTVGVGGNYTTLTDAVAAYNTSCLSGPVVFSLTDATYPTETFPITLNQNPSSSAVNTLTIRPAAGISPTIAGSSASAIIRLFGADFVTIDGSNNGSTSKDLTIENTNAAGTSVIWIGNSSSPLNAALSNLIQNTNITGNGPSTTVAGIIISSGATAGSAAEISNSNNSVVNNSFKKAQNGIFAIGNATTLDAGWNFSNNSLGSNTPAEYLGFRGIAVQNAQGFVVSGNQISGVTTATSSTVSGILVGAVINGGSVVKNTITNVRNTNTGGWGSNGIFLNSGAANTGLLVANNFISDVASNGFASGWAQGDNGYGIMVNAGGGYQILHNSINLSTNQTVAANSAAINIASGVTNLNIRNNIFVNGQTTGTRYAVYSAVANTAFTAINFNDYVSGGSIGFLGSARATLADWQTATGQDANSVNIPPVFTSGTDLHLPLASNVALLDLGTAISSVTDDIDGQPRGTTPDMGADEFGNRPSTPSSLTQTSTTPSCTGGTVLFALPAAPSNVVYYLQTSAADTSVTNPFVGDSVLVFTNGTYFVKAKNTITNLWSAGSASVVITNVPVAPLPPSPVADASPACLTTNITVPAPTNPNVTFYWQGTTNGGTSASLNASTPFVVTSSGTYYVAAFDASSNCWSNTNGVSVVIDTYVPGTPTVGTDIAVCSGATSAQITGSTPGPGSVQAVLGTNIISSGEAPVILNAVIPAIPAGATVTGTQLILTNVNAINGSWRSEIRVALSGATTLSATQISTLNSGGLITPDPVINIPNVPVSGGAVTLTITETFNDLGVNDATFGEAKIVVNYTLPPSTITWWDAATAGSQVGSGSPLQTVGTSLLPNTGTPGTYTFYAQSNSISCTSSRVPVNVTVNPLPVIDAGTAFSACPLTPITLTATGANSYVWNNGVIDGVPFQAPTVSTVFTATGTDLNGCSNTDTITVSALFSTPLSITASGPTTICQGDPLSLTVTGLTAGPLEILTQWNFNGNSSLPSIGSGSASLVGGTTATFASGVGSSDTTTVGDQAWNTTNYPAQGTGAQTAGVQFNVSTAGYKDIVFDFDIRQSGTAANTYVVQYNPDVTNGLTPWFNVDTFTYSVSSVFANDQTVDLTAFPAANNNPNLGIRVVSAFDAVAGQYAGVTSAYSVNGTVRYDMVTFSGKQFNYGFQWNNGATTQTISPTQTGMYSVVVNSPGSCPGFDSVFVTVNPTFAITLNPQICDNQTYTLPLGQVVNQSGIYQDTLTTVFGCDSIVIVNLVVNPTFNTTVNPVICSNETYTLADGTSVTAPGTYVLTVPTISGCDSTVTANLTVLPAQSFNVSAVICADGSYTLPDGTSVNTAGTYTTVFAAANGCDSTFVTQLTVKPIFSTVLNPVICANQSYTMPDGTTQNQAGTYTFPYTAVNGCDSTFTVNLTVNPIFTTNVTANICPGQTYTLADGTFANTTGTYSVTVPTVFTGCDSTVIVDLTVRPTYNNVFNASICQGQTYTLANGVVVNSPGSYTAGTASIYGCDSIVTINLTVNPVFTQTVSAVICQGEIYELPDGVNAITQGTYTSVLQTVKGCDSTIITNLTVNPLPNVNLGANIAVLNPPVVLNGGAGNTSYLWNTGATTQTINVTQNGTYSVTVTNSFGCSASDTVTVNFTASVGSFGDNGATVNIFPNPANQRFTLSVNGYEGGEIQFDILNALGMVVKTERFANLGSEFTHLVDVADLAAGTYLVRLKSGNAESTLRLLIAK